MIKFKSMNQSKKPMKSIAKYLRELSIVITGISLTVGIGLWVSDINNKKDLKQYLLSVKLELEENAKEFDHYAKWMQKPLRYADYLRATDDKSLNEDSLSYYLTTDDDGCGLAFSHIPIETFKTHAFEMLKTSGAMRQIKDREFLLSICDAYSTIESAKVNLDRAFRRREEEVMKWLPLYLEGLQTVAPLRSYYVAGFAFVTVQLCKDTSEAIKETLSKFYIAKKDK